MKFSGLITQLHSASQPHMLMYIDIRSDCELADVNILASGQSEGYLATAALHLTVPMSFAGKLLPPAQLDLRVDAKYVPKF